MPVGRGKGARVPGRKPVPPSHPKANSSRPGSRPKLAALPSSTASTVESFDHPAAPGWPAAATRASTSSVGVKLDCRQAERVVLERAEGVVLERQELQTRLLAMAKLAAAGTAADTAVSTDAGTAVDSTSDQSGAQVKAGRVVAVVASSGAGKSTLLAMAVQRARQDQLWAAVR